MVGTVRTLVLSALVLGVCGLAAETSLRLYAANQEEKKAEDSKDEKPKFQETKSGLKYRVLREGKGAKPKAADTVKVHYKGWLDDGKEFDSSYKRKEPISFPLGRVIPGWTEGMQLVGEGGEIELEIPARLGYGERGVPGAIPPNATLHFTVELLEVTAK